MGYEDNIEEESYAAIGNAPSRVKNTRSPTQPVVYHRQVISLGEYDAVGGFLSLRRDPFFHPVGYALRIQSLLLLNLPQDWRRRWLRDQHHGPRGHGSKLAAKNIFRSTDRRKTIATSTKKTGCQSRRYFCSNCGSALWVHGTDYPDFVYPFASAIDTPLPEPRK